MPDDAPDDAGPDEARRRAQWRQTDVRRAIAAAEKAALTNYRVEIASDGTISIVVGPPPSGVPET
jgi:hypothetical protein